MPDSSKVLLTLDHLTRYDGKIKTWTEGVYKIVEQATAETGYFKTYKLQANGTDAASSVKINIPKDFVVKAATVGTCSTADTPVTGLAVGDKYIDLAVNTVDAADNTNATHLYIAVKDLVSAYTAGDGIEIDANNEISIKIGAGLELNSSTGVIDLITLSGSSAAGSVGGITKADYDDFKDAADATTAFTVAAGTATTATSGNATVTTTPYSVTPTTVGGTAGTGFTVNNTDTTYGNATATNGATPAAAGLMSGTDKDNLDALTSAKSGYDAIVTALGSDVSIATDSDIDALFD